MIMSCDPRMWLSEGATPGSRCHGRCYQEEAKGGLTRIVSIPSPRKMNLGSPQKNNGSHYKLFVQMNIVTVDVEKGCYRKIVLNC
jgi:hypothetical protein